VTTPLEAVADTDVEEFRDVASADAMLLTVDPQVHVVDAVYALTIILARPLSPDVHRSPERDTVTLPVPGVAAIDFSDPLRVTDPEAGVAFADDVIELTLLRLL
jgi:hypothetical protein